ncbi:hypothetical protein [Vacuolonema iberomarrocanum]|uniref:hypothetical protein n=1 Tax=Vacuolonema iberomarrocanum TaxID=3454632 RepID=UPI0019E2BCB1|nr:hypothetical protein [filamentous cyanobacterium LEGE 07170]
MASWLSPIPIFKLCTTQQSVKHSLEGIGWRSLLIIWLEGVQVKAGPPTFAHDPARDDR